MSRSVSASMAWTAASYFFIPVAALATAPLLAQGLGVSGRGTVAAATAPLMLAASFFAFGIPQSLTHFLAVSPASKRRLLKFALIVQIVGGILGSALLHLLGPALSGGKPSIAELITIAGLVLPLSLVAGIVRGAASGLHLWKLVSLERILSELFKVVALALLFLTGNLTVLSAVVTTVIGTFIGAPVYFRRVFSSESLDARYSAVRPPNGGEMLGYGARIWIGTLSGLLLTRLSQILMTPFSSVHQLGLYVAAVNVSDATLLANNAVRDVTLASDSEEQSNTRAVRSARVSLLISGIVGLSIVLTAPLWFTRFFGQGFEDSLPMLYVLCIANVIGVPGSVAGSVLSARGHPGIRSAGLTIAAVVNVCVLVLLLPVLGGMGAALSALVGNLIASNFNILFCKRLFGIKFWSFYLVRLNDVRFLAQKLLNRFA